MMSLDKVFSCMFSFGIIKTTSCSATFFPLYTLCCAMAVYCISTLAQNKGIHEPTIRVQLQNIHTIWKPGPCQGFLLTSTSLGAHDPLSELKLALLIGKRNSILYNPPKFHLGLEKEAERIWVCRRPLDWLCFLMHLDNMGQRGLKTQLFPHL